MVDKDKSNKAAVAESIKQIQIEMDKRAQQDAAKQKQADEAAAAARFEKATEKANKIWGNSKDTEERRPRDTVHGLATSMAKEGGGKTYDTYPSAMYGVIELCYLLHQGLAADIRSGERLVNLVGWMGQSAGKGVDALASLSQKWFANNTFRLPESIVNCSSCDAAGKVTFDTLKAEVPVNTDPELIKKLDNLHMNMVTGFLKSKGYEENADHVFKKKGVALTQNQFESLKQNHLADYASTANIKMTDKPVQYVDKEHEAEPSPYRPK